ncbi:MAG: SixA phosphatase family protein [Phycisphaerales bacterium]
MRTLIVMRHGKAEAESESGLDADRVLAKRGYRQVDFVSERLLERDRSPVLIGASFVRRARQTADALAEALESAGVRCVVRRERALELGHERATLDGVGGVVSGLFRDHRRGAVILVGHNPQLELLTNVMESAGGGGAGGAMRLQTGMACVFEVGDVGDALSSARLVERIRLAE